MIQKFAWNEALNTGIRMIDVQHKELVAAANDLADAINEGQGTTAIKKILIFLKYYAEWHFQHEEQCARRHQCAIAAANEQAHATFIQRFGHLHEQYRQSDVNEDVARQIYEELSSWLVNHILKVDTQIGACVNQAKATQDHN